MIWLIDIGYTKEDIEYIHEILDEILTHNPLCDRECQNCKKLTICKELHTLHKYIHKVYTDC